MDNFRIMPERVIDSEKGVLLPLVAVIILTIIVVLVALSIDVNRVKTAQALAEKRAESMCSVLVSKLPFVRLAVSDLSNVVSQWDEIPGGSVDLDSWTTIKRVTLITPTNDGNLAFPNPFNPGGSWQGWNDPLTVYGHPDNCQDNVCSFSADVLNNGVAGNPGPGVNYPVGFWDYAKFYGYLGCEIETQVNTLVSGTKTANAKVVYRARVQGTPLNPALNPKGRGITIGIAPQVDTLLPPDLRFIFASPEFDAQNPNFGSQVFQDSRQTYLDPAYNDTLADSQPVPAGPKSLDAARRRCYNPFLAVRNTLLQSIVARLERFWFTRDNTQILILNPLSLTGSPPNPPTLLVENGQDMMGLYQLPYINYKHDGTKGGSSPSGHLCPFDGGCLMASSQDARHHMLIASELRDCYFTSNTANGIITWEDLGLVNTSYEPPWFTSLNQVPFSYPDPIETGWGFNRVPHDLKPDELMRILGSVEECPYQWSGVPSITDCTTPPAVEPSHLLPPRGLRADIVAFLRYTAGADPARENPGFLEPPDPGGRIPPLKDTPETTSQILLVLSKPLDPDRINPDSEINSIRNTVLNSIQPDRRITVVFIPTYFTTDNDQTYSDLKYAFNAENSSDPNQVFRLFPPPCGTTPEDQCFRDYWENLLRAGSGNINEIAEGIFTRLVIREPAL